MIDNGIIFGCGFSVLMVGFVTGFVWLKTRREMIKNGTWDAYKNNGYSN